MNMSRKRIGILTDSSCDLDNEEAKAMGIHVVRMPLTIDGKTYLEGVDITDAQVIEAMEKGAVISTSQPILGTLIETIDRLLEEYEQLLYVPISSGLSGTCASGQAIEHQYEGRLVVVDCKAVCWILTYYLQNALEMIDKGYSALEIKEMLENGYYMAILMPRDLNALKRGGRVSAAAATLGNLLKIIPLLKVEYGVIDAYDKVRTLRKAHALAVDTVTSIENKQDYTFACLYTYGYEQEAKEIKKMMEEKLGVPVHFHLIRSVIAAHTGPGTIGIGYIKNFNF